MSTRRKRHQPPEFQHPPFNARALSLRASGAPGPMGSANTRRLRQRGQGERAAIARSARHD